MSPLDLQKTNINHGQNGCKHHYMKW